MSKTIAILTSGGDAPGMNAAIRAATMVAVAKGHRMLGIRHGYRGLLDEKISELDADRVNGILREGGTIQHSARCKRFHFTHAPRAKRAPNSRVGRAANRSARKAHNALLRSVR